MTPLARSTRTDSLKIAMRRRLTTAAILAALLAVHLGVPCLALAQAQAQAHDSMADATSSGPCETSAAPTAALLCAAPSAYVPIAAGMPDVAPVALAPAPYRQDVDLVAREVPRELASHGADPPTYLLLRALLI